MDSGTKKLFGNLKDNDKEIQYAALMELIEITQGQVNWAYEVWDQLIEDLKNGDNHERSRAGQLLCNLAISDPEKRIIKDFPTVWAVAHDNKFVTARHTLKAVWKIALAGSEQKEMVLKNLSNRFINGTKEKNYTLIRYDIIDSLRELYEELEDEQVKQLALNLIEIEEDPKYKKKYASVWK